MPLDSSIPLAARVAQIQSPYEALGQIAQLHQMRDAAEARRLAGEEARTRALEAKATRQRQAQIDAAIDAAYSGPVDPTTGRPTLDRSKLSAHLPGHLRYEVDQQLDEDAKKGLEFTTAKLNRATTQLDLDTKRRSFLGSQLRTIRAANYDPSLWAIEIRAAQRAGALDDENADRLIGITDPAQIQALTDQYIAAAEGAKEAPQVGTLGDYLARVARSRGVPVTALTPEDITIARTAFEAAGRAPAAPPSIGSFEDYIARDAAQRGTPVERYTTGDIDQLRERYRLDTQGPDPILSQLRQMQLDAAQQAAQSGGNWTPKQVQTFNQIAGAYERSPLIRAADRTIVLKDAIKAAKADPKNATNQLNLAYSYIQALDTYQSAVREGELQNLGMLGTRLQQLGVTVDRYVTSGAFIPPAVASQIATSAEQLAKTIEAGQRQKQREFGSRARVSGVGEMWDEFVAGFQAPPETGGGASGPTEGTRQPIPGVPGGEAEYRGGRWIRVK